MVAVKHVPRSVLKDAMLVHIVAELEIARAPAATAHPHVLGATRALLGPHGLALEMPFAAGGL